MNPNAVTFQSMYSQPSGAAQGSDYSQQPQQQQQQEPQTQQSQQSHTSTSGMDSNKFNSDCQGMVLRHIPHQSILSILVLKVVLQIVSFYSAPKISDQIAFKTFNQLQAHQLLKILTMANLIKVCTVYY